MAINYPGGKGAAFRHIINEIPPHDIYIELFFGGGAVARKKRPARLNLGIDRDFEPLAIAKNGVAAENFDLLQMSAIDFLDSWQPPAGRRVFIYADPPYLMSVRSYQRPLYNFEFGSEAEHIALLTRLRAAANGGAMVAISGYESELYSELIGDWRRVSYRAVKRSGAVVDELLFTSYGEPARLHDYRYLGVDFRERERIKRKGRRWVDRLARLPILEQRAILARMSEAGFIE